MHQQQLMHDFYLRYKTSKSIALVSFDPRVCLVEDSRMGMEMSNSHFNRFIGGSLIPILGKNGNVPIPQNPIPILS